MTLKRINVGVAAAVCAMVLPGFAEDAAPAETLFRAGETSLDLFGTVSVGQHTINHISRRRVEDNGRLGLGLGGNYFFSRNVGLGIDGYSENTQHSFVDSGSANLIVRFPIDDIHLAPYVFGGGGREFDPNDVWFGQLGGGVEFRFTRQVGLFADARYVLTDETPNYGVGRLGLRCSF